MTRWLIIMLLSFLLGGFSLAQASPYGLTGEWEMNANGWTFVLEINESGTDFKGVMRPQNHQGHETRVAGTVSPNGAVEFLRYLSANNVQRYTGYVFNGVEKKRGIAGTFSHNSSQFGWFAQRSGSGIGAPQQQVHKLFTVVPNQSSAAFKANTAEKLRVDTSSWDRVPYHITKAFHGQFTIQPGQQVILAGDAAGTKNWGVDNFLFLEFRYGQSVKRFVIGQHDPVSFNGQNLQKIGPAGFSFAPNAVDFSTHLPTSTPIHFTAYALDYGGSGWVSDVYLVVR